MTRRPSRTSPERGIDPDVAGHAPKEPGARETPDSSRFRDRAERRDRGGRAKGRVSFVGAGSGDPDLITVRGAEAIATADVILHDPDVIEAIAGRARRDAEVRSSDDFVDVARELATHARAGRCIVRLVEGDPLLFARASTEIDAIAAASIEFEVIPGVSSLLAAAARAGIPLSKGRHGSVTFSAASPQVMPTQMRAIHVTDRVFDNVVATLLGEEHPDTPAAATPWPMRGPTPTVVATLGDLVARCRDVDLTPPLVLFVGEQVLRQAAWVEAQPLFGLRVLVPRAREQAIATTRLLRARGAIPVDHPSIVIAPAEDPAPLQRALASLDAVDLIAFTSANGVDAFFRALSETRRDARALAHARIAAIGSGTEQALATHAIRADVVSDEHRGEALAEAILRALRDRKQARVLLPRAAVARSVLPDALRAAGHVVDDIAVYRTLPVPAEDADALRGSFARRSIDAVVFTSASTVDALVDLVGVAPLAEVTLASIGPVTTERCKKRGLTVAAEAKPYTIPALLEALAQVVRARPRER